MFSLFFILVGYILGSIPFGYIFSKIAGKNILEIGWRKTSASNVFRNVGFFPALGTVLGDTGKGFLAVYLAKKFGFPVFIQAFCGVAAILGHNWSIFIKFAGGRGIATFLGALFALSPKILGLSLLVFFLVTIICTSPIGTIAFLLATIFFSFQAGQLTKVGLLPLFSLGPIFLKRLSPIKELSLQKKDIILNRLLFDDDFPKFDFGILKIIKKLTEKINKDKIKVVR